MLHPSQFVRFARGITIAAALFGSIEILAGFITQPIPLIPLGIILLGVALISYIASALTRSGRLRVGVYTWSFGTAVAMVGSSMLTGGLLPIILALFILDMLVVALFISPRLTWRMVLPLLVLLALSTAAEGWATWPRLDMMGKVPIILLVSYPTILGFVFVLINLLNQTLLQAVESAQSQATQLEESRAALSERTLRLEELTADLRAHGEEQRRLNEELQTTAQRAERRAKLLATSAHVARAVSQVRDLDQLLPEVTNLISQAFGYYHVGIFIVDEIGRYAVLRASNSEGGQRMLARNHKLPVGQTGIVGYVTGTGQHRIASDVGTDAVHFDNPDLPHTRSEMALPLAVGGQVIGALDVQSEQEAAFSEEDVSVLSTLADQIAIAIESADLLAKTQAALEEAEETQRRYIQQQWEQLIPTLLTAHYEYRVSGVSSVGDALLPEMERAIQEGETVTLAQRPAESQNSDSLTDTEVPMRAAMAVPIKFRDEVIGVIDLHEVDTEREWTEGDIAFVAAVADQAAQALENVRLLNQTQQRAQRERLITEITARMRAAPDAEAILRTAVHEIRRALGASHGTIRLTTKRETEA